MTFFKKHFSLLIVICLTLLGLSLRLSHFSQMLWLQPGFDDQRDMLVSKHIVEFGAVIHRGPLASGGFNWLENSPIYYYVTAVMWFFTRSVVGFVAGFIVLTSLVIPISYFVGKRLSDKTTGYLAALLCAISPELIFSSREFSQPYLLPICLLLLFWNLTYHPNLKRICLSVFLLLLPLHFHYGILLFLPIGLFWILVDWLRVCPKEFDLHLTSFKFFLPLLSLILFGLGWIFTTYHVVPFDQVFFLLFNYQAVGQPSFTANLQTALATFFQVIWPQVSFLSVVAILSLFVLGYFQLRSTSQQHTSKRIKDIFWSFLASYGLVFLFRGHVTMSYVIGFLPFQLLALALGLRWLIQRQRFIAWLVIFLVSATAIKATLNNLRYGLPNESIYQQLGEISQDIYQNYQQLPQQETTKSRPDFGLVTLVTGNHQPYDGWGNFGVWNWLEHDFHQQLIQLTDFGSNIQPINQAPKYLYFICDHRVQPEEIATQCLDRFQRVRTYLLPGYQLVGETADFSVWRFETTLPQKNESSYYYAYPDLLK